jgi:predicted RNA binding protein YcfA (HicA-like mRNA interferase family)
VPKLLPLHYATLLAIFEADGFREVRRRGDHVVLTKPGVKRPVVIKTSPRDVAVTHIRTNMTTAGMSRERYFALLARITGKKLG